MNIRRAVYADCAALAALDAVCNPSAWTQRQFESALVSPSEQVFLAEKDGELAAFIVWQNLPDESELHLIATALEYRRRGVASALLNIGSHICPKARNACCLKSERAISVRRRCTRHTALPMRAGGKTITVQPTVKPKMPS